MKKIIRSCIYSIAVISGLLFSGTMLFANTIVTYEEGHHYSMLEQPRNLNSNKVVVEKIFWYGCKHCYQLNMLFNPWVNKLLDKVEVNHLPASYSKRWLPHSRLYFITKELGVSSQLNHKIYQTIHHTSNKLMNEDNQKAFLKAETSLTEIQIASAFESTEIDNLIELKMKRVKELDIKSVPTIVINGKYKVNPQMAGSYQAMLDIAEYLIEIELKAKNQQNHAGV